MNPRLGTQLQISGTDLESRATLRRAWAYDMVVLDLELTQSPGLLAQLLERNPRLAIYFYTSPAEIATSPATNQTLEAARRAQLEQHPEWYVIGTTGQRITSWTGLQLLDVTNAAYRAAYVERHLRLVEQAGLTRPRIFLDRFESNVYYMGDPGNQFGNARISLDRNGTATTFSNLGTRWVEGFSALGDELRAAGFETMVNLGWNSTTAYADHVDHGMIEDFHRLPAPSYAHWYQQLKTLCRFGSHSLALVKRDWDPTDPDYHRDTRFAMCAAMLAQPRLAGDRGVLCGVTNASVPSAAYVTTQECDLMGCDLERGVTSSGWQHRHYLGRALGPATMGDGSSFMDALLSSSPEDAAATWSFREFEHGWGLLNPTDTDITGPNHWGGRKLLGVGDPATLDGTAPLSITIPAGDGLVLLKAR